MSFNIKDKEIGDFDKIHYHYPKQKIYKNQYEKTVENGGYIKIAYSQQPNVINIDYADYESGYVTKNIYISKKVHTIDSMDFEGELLIEHVSNTNGFKPLYVCIPLKTNKKIKQTVLDNIISQKESIIELELNDILGKSDTKTILYDSPGYLTEQSVILFTEPIEVKSSFDSFQMVDVVKNYDESYKIIIASHQNLDTTTPTPSSLKEGFESETSTSTAYCQPIEEAESDIQNQANLEIPLKGKYSLQDAEYEYIKVVVSFTSYFLMMILGYLGAPSMYRYLIIDLVNENPNLKTCMARAGRLYSIDIYICAIMIMFIYALMSSGVSTNSKGQTTTALLVFILFVVSMLRIYFFKISPDSDYTELIKCVQKGEDSPENENPDDADPKEYDVENIKQDLFDFLSENVGELSTVFTGFILIAFFVVSTIVLIATKSGSFWFFGLLFDIYITIFYIVKAKLLNDKEDQTEEEEEKEEKE